MNKLISVLISTFLLSTNLYAENRSESDGAASRIEADVRFLASDLLEGREAGTRGYDLAAAYVAERLRAIGLEPGVGDSYLQQVPLVEFEPASENYGELTIMRDGVPIDLVQGVDYAVLPNVMSRSSEVEGPLVFVGQGIDSPFFGRNDYKGLDLKGKIAVYFISTDPTLPSEEAAHFRRMILGNVSDRGAVGALTLYTPGFEKIIAFEKLAKMVKSDSRMRWLEDNGTPHEMAPNIKAGAFLSDTVGEKLFAYGDLSWESILEKIKTGEVPSFDMEITARIKTESRHRNLFSHNVVGVLPGSDPKLRNEFVLVTGHLDHEGVKTGHSPESDQLFNGAMDNAVGIATMLEVATQMAKNPPRRSVIFLAVTAEEKGLIGSDYYAHNPTVDKRSIVANINIDMPVLTYEFEDVVAFGASHSSLKQLAAESIEGLGVQLVPDPAPEQAIFVRSDQYSFVKQGVPAIYLDTGPGGEGKEATGKFFEEHYHEPSDEWSLIRYPVAAKFSLLNQKITAAVANAEERPRWNEGDFFSVTFGPEKNRLPEQALRTPK
ncbi:M20/M25/M40 family metallo-hydrolase [uncultured Microbulbifer sp.]|uniref:M20/M25/M40 family metallo-hydrolase n=1 Tax=uncultured Microbulbifer sp. TaxID=348147 RepID=UPI0025E9F46B|nr:M20/M25/M40 family metallo-hydrolase [uncultured Microbulbifer sp.]